MQKGDQANKAGTPKEGEEPKNRGWPKGRKRYLKIPGAPKQPLSGYVHFLNDRRENLRKENPDFSFADVSKKLATEWSQMAQEQKQKYEEIAKQDKERYSKEFADFKLTDEYKKYMESQQAKRALSSPGNEEPPKKKYKKSGNLKSKGTSSTPATPANSTSQAGEDNLESKEDSVGGLDFPIFTREFLEFNKSRESELKQLRKQVTEMEEQNAVLKTHVENMQSATSKLDLETNQLQENTSALTKHLDSLRSAFVAAFQGASLKGFEKITDENVDELLSKMHQVIVKESGEVADEDHQFASKVKEVVAKMDLSSLAKA